MATKLETASADGIDFPLSMPDGRTLVLPDLSLAIAVEDGTTVKAVTIEASVAHEVYEIIEQTAMFHLEPENRGQHYEKSFDAARDVELELGLRADLLKRVEDEGGAESFMAVATFIAWANEAADDEPMLDGANWYALNVKQDQGGGLKTGYATVWAGRDRLGE